MRPRAFVNVAKVPALVATIALTRDSEAFARLGFLRVAVRTGLLEAIGDGASFAALVDRMDVVAADLLDGLLRLGVALGELGGSPSRYTVKGRRARAIASPKGDALQALLLEIVEYHGSVYDQLPDRLRGAPVGDYLASTAALVARSSRVLEPFIGAFVRDMVRDRRPVTLLEIGCGTGVYLRHALKAAPGLSCVAIDMDPEVVALAQRNVMSWGLADRASVRRGDIRSLDEPLSGPFDLITLHNNIYYFTTAERAPLFGHLAELLSPRGALCVVSMTAGGTVAGTDLDLTLRSTAGCAPLPELDQLREQLRQAGFMSVVSTSLLPLEPLHAVVASR